MNATVIVTPAALGKALDAAADLGARNIAGVAAPTEATVLGLVNEAWDAISSAFSRVYEFGSELVEEAYASATATVKDVLKRAGARAREIHQQLMARISAFSHELLLASLANVSSKLRVGDVQLELTSIRNTQNLKLGGSISANIEELVKLMADGELSIETEYRLPKST